MQRLVALGICSKINDHPSQYQVTYDVVQGFKTEFVCKDLGASFLFGKDLS